MIFLKIKNYITVTTEITKKYGDMQQFCKFKKLDTQHILVKSRRKGNI